jgi:hypothetical protein
MLPYAPDKRLKDDCSVGLGHLLSKGYHPVKRERVSDEKRDPTTELSFPSE